MSGVMRDEREERLPKWAQNQMCDLRRRVVDAEREREDARLATAPAACNTLIDPYADIPIGLGKGTTVRFCLGEGVHREWVDGNVRSDSDGTYLYLQAGGAITITPRASNVIRVEVQP